MKLYYAQVKTYVAAGNKSAASKALGILAHYYADVCNPLHTDNYYTEGFTHNRYELKVDTLTRSATTNSAWAVLDGLEPVVDADAAYAKTVAAAVLVPSLLPDPVHHVQVEGLQHRGRHHHEELPRRGRQRAGRHHRGAEVAGARLRA